MNKTVQDWYENPGLFWKGFKNSAADAHAAFALHEWSAYFQSLFGATQAHQYVGGSLACMLLTIVLCSRRPRGGRGEGRVS